MLSEQKILKQIKECNPGDLIFVDWCDASTGKSSVNGGVVDVPVRSWGVYLGFIGDRVKHIILAQNSFQFTNDLYDLDYTAIPLGWALKIHCIQPSHLPQQIVSKLLCSFSSDYARRNTAGLRSPRISSHRMQRLSQHGFPI